MPGDSSMLTKKTGQERFYDPKPRVSLLNERAGLYALKWVGYDGMEKTIVYQRPDAIDAIVIAEGELPTATAFPHCPPN
jgi:hypothetical protein